MRLTLAIALALTTIYSAAARADVPPGTPYVESATHPIRVYYAAPAPKSQADAMVVELDQAWDAEIGEMGFHKPLRVLDGKIVEGFNMIIQTLGPTVGYTFEVLGDNPATPALDCPLLGIASTSFLALGGYTQDCAWHVLNHASLHAVDCLETSVPANDIFSIGVELCRDLVPATFAKEENETFQRLPEWSLDAVALTEADVYYSFGSSLYALFLEEKYGARDGKLLAEIWRHTPQDGHVLSVDTRNTEVIIADVVNGPTWWDAVAATLTAKGASFDDAYVEFALWRLLVGKYSDGLHYRKAAAYPVPAFSKTFDPAALPVANQHPTTKLGRYGTGYILVDSSKLATGKALKLGFAGYKPFKWAAQAICLMSAASPVVTSFTLNALNTGSVVVPDAVGCQAVVLAAENLSDGPHNPDKQEWNLDGDFLFSASVIDMPSITTVTPSTLPPGASGVAVTVRGSQFVNGASLAASFGEGVTVDKLESVDETSLHLTVTVAADAKPGPCALKVTNGQGLVATLEGALTLEIPADAGAPGVDAASPGVDAATAGVDAGWAGDAGATEPKSTGCGCANAGTAPMSMALSLLTLLCLGRKRR